MNKTLTTIIVIALLVVIAGGIAIAIQRTQGQTGDQRPPVSDEKPDNGDENGAKQRITARHEFEDGTHTVAGSLNLPTPCHQLEVTPVVQSAESVMLNVNVTTTAEMCAQVIQERRFKVDFEAEENAEINATYNGEPATLNLIPVPEGESLDDFEVEVKG